MESQGQPATPEETPTGEEPVGFWKRVFGGKQGPEEGDGGEAPPPAPTGKNRPRKRTKTIFEQAEEQQRRRYAKAALVRRERLANAIGERFEAALDQRMETSEERLAEVAGVFDDMNVLLGAIGRNLDNQNERAERVAQTIERLPVAAAEEHEVLTTIAERLEGQAASVEGVPEVVSLVRQGSKVAEERLVVLQGLRYELEAQRDQGAQVLDVLRKSAQRFEERMCSLEEAIVKGRVEARSDAQSLRGALERTVEQSQEEARREAQRSAQVVEGLRDVGMRLAESNALATAAARAEEKTRNSFQDSHEEMIDVFVQAQHRTMDEMHRLQEERREREEELAKRSRLTLVGASGFLAMAAAMLIGWSSPSEPQVAPIYVPVRTVAKPQTKPRDEAAPRALPAGMPRGE